MATKTQLRQFWMMRIQIFNNIYMKLTQKTVVTS